MFKCFINHKSLIIINVAIVVLVIFEYIMAKFDYWLMAFFLGTTNSAERSFYALPSCLYLNIFHVAVDFFEIRSN